MNKNNKITEGLFQPVYSIKGLNEALKAYFGHDSFRPNQKELITGLLEGRNMLGVLPTGTGKSIVYQLPALLMEGVVLVISPLIALMEDQCISFNKRMGEDQAVFINSNIGVKRRRETIALIEAEKVKLIYLAPETMKNAEMGTLLKKLTISAVAIDEAHVLSSWGMDFRKSYRLIPELIRKLGVQRVIALTATAPKKVRDDVAKLVGIRQENIIVAPSDRPNLSYEVRKKGGTVINEISAIIESFEEGGIIIYCFTKKDTEMISGTLNRRGHETAFYHSQIPKKRKTELLQDFIDNKVRVIVATNAFGLGIDKPDVRAVIHYSIPQSIEAYSQETGRSGRDGKPSECVLFYRSQDVGKLRWIIGKRSNNALNPHQLLDKMQLLVETPPEEFRDKLINYFK